MSDFSFDLDPSAEAFRRDLRALEGKLENEIQKRNKKIAKWVADEVESEYSSDFEPISGEGARSISATNDGGIRMGGSAAPYVLGQNFGSNQSPNTDQFPSRKEPDYFLYATIADSFGKIQKEHLQGVDEAFEDAFPD